MFAGCASRPLLAGVVALAAAGWAGEADPWAAPPLRRAVEAWARAEALRLAGEPAESARSYARAATLSRHALTGRRDPIREPILTTLLRLSLEGRAATGSAAGAASKAVPAQEMLRRLGQLKIRGDRLVAEGKGLRAHLAYRSFLEASDLFRRRHPDHDGVKAVRWLRGRVERSLRELPRDLAPAPARHDPSLEEAIRNALDRPEESRPLAPEDPLGLTLGPLDAAVRLIPQDCAYSRVLDHPPDIPAAYAARAEPFGGRGPRNAVGRALEALLPYGGGPGPLGADSAAFSLAGALRRIPLLSPATADRALGSDGPRDPLLALAGLPVLAAGAGDQIDATEASLVGILRRVLPGALEAAGKPTAVPEPFRALPPPFGVPTPPEQEDLPPARFLEDVAALPVYAELTDPFDSSRPDALALRGVRGVVRGLRSAAPGSPEALSAEEGGAFLDWLLASDVGGDVVGGLAEALSRPGRTATEGGVTMGGAEAAKADYRGVALDAYLSVIQRHPERDLDGGVLRRALHLAAELGRVPETVALIGERLNDGRPGLLGVLQFRLLLEQKRADEAYALLGRMTQAPDHFLPANPATAEVLARGFTRFIAQSSPEAAERALEAAERLERAPQHARRLALASAYRAAGRPGDARRIAEALLKGSPDRETAARAKALLVRLRREPAGGRPVLTPDELALLAEEAKIDPRRYFALAREYRRARAYDAARRAYDLAARRFSSLDARRAVVETYFEEGRDAEGLRHAEAFLADHHDAPQADALRRLVMRRSAERGDPVAWAKLCQRLTASARGDVAAFYAGRLAAVMVKAERGGGTPYPTRVAAFARQLRASPAWPLVQAQVPAHRQAVARDLPSSYQLPDD